MFIRGPREAAIALLRAAVVAASTLLAGTHWDGVRLGFDQPWQQATAVTAEGGNNPDLVTTEYRDPGR